jgi:hypothetical protein
MPEICRFYGIIVLWSEIHEEELMNNWRLARERKPLMKVPPLP